MTIFDHIKNLTVTKQMCTDEELKTFDVYMVNRMISMHIDFLEYVADLQLLINSGLSKKQIYRIYLSYLPQQSSYAPYIKKTQNKKFNVELINIIKKYFDVTENVAIHYLHILYMDSELNEIKSILEKYGIVAKKDINKLIKIK